MGTATGTKVIHMLNKARTAESNAGFGGFTGQAVAEEEEEVLEGFKP